MTAQFVLSYPFRVDINNRRLGTINSETDTYKAEQINAFLRTEKEERALFPAFGITDPVFHKFDSGEFVDSFLEFYKPSEIAIENVDILEEGGNVLNVSVGFK
jgi:hypothetical protein|tara:strand:+ start:202 stop:510 length:309 start_codon:yes stop_codon:yes gene_type:complete